MANSKVRVGVLGAGGILGAHAPALKASADLADVVAVAESDESRWPRVKEFFGPQVRLVRDYRELVAAQDVDAVDILLPHSLHGPATELAAANGKHVLTEKVMARNVWECDRMIAACAKAGVTLTVCHDRRYHDEWIALKQVVDSGVLGEILWWKLDHNQNVYFGGKHWASTRDGIGGGAIMSCLTHQLDALRWYGGEATAVTCMTKVVPARMEGECIGLMGVQMASGALANLHINWYTSSNHVANGLWYEMVQVCGTTGEAYYMSGKGTWVLAKGAADLPWTWEQPPTTQSFARVPTGKVGGHQRCVREWLKLVSGQPAAVTTTGADSRRTVELAEAAYLSVAEGRTVQLPITPRPWVSATPTA